MSRNARSFLPCLLLAIALPLGCDEAIEPPPGNVGVDYFRVFVTNTTQNAGLGGPSGADALCAEQAIAGGLPGLFKAWLSTLDMPARERLQHASGPYVRVDNAVVANDWADLVDGTLLVPIDIDARGDRQSGEVWTGTLATGASYVGDDCAGFTSSNLGNAQCGTSEATNATWTQNITPACSTPLRLYCIQQ